MKYSKYVLVVLLTLTVTKVLPCSYKETPVATYTSRCQRHPTCICPTNGLPAKQKNIF